jgi:hypothetical protein
MTGRHCLAQAMEPVKNLTSHENLFNSRENRTMREKVSRMGKATTWRNIPTFFLKFEI